MKKILLVSIAILAASYSFSQNTYRSVGTVEFGGDFGFASQNYENGGGSQTTISSDLYVGYMVAEGFSLGLRPGFNIQNSDGDSYKTINLFFNPNYNINTSSNVIPFIGALIGNGSISFEINNNEDKISGLGIGAEAGLKFPVMNSGMFLFRLEYLSQTYNYEAQLSAPPASNSETINTLMFSAGFRMFIVRGGVRPVVK